MARSPMAQSPSAGPGGPGAPAILVLEDGTTFRGTSFGAEGETFGEMVFNTGMTGYQETLTDPSYCRQIVAMTAPHIGNTGINDEDPESRRIWVSGFVVRKPARMASSWRSQRSLDDELRAQGITGIAITGTRALTRHLRERGAMRAGIAAGTADAAPLRERVLASPPDDRGGPGPRGVHRRAPPPVHRRTVWRSDTGSRPWTWASRPPRRWPWPGWAARSPVLPAASTADGDPVRRARTEFFSPTARATRLRLATPWTRSGASLPGASRCLASAWAARSWAGLSAWAPTSSGSGTAA